MDGSAKTRDKRQTRRRTGWYGPLCCVHVRGKRSVSHVKTVEPYRSRIGAARGRKALNNCLK